jgi:hypothetical protein
MRSEQELVFPLPLLLDIVLGQGDLLPSSLLEGRATRLLAKLLAVFYL